MIFLILAIGLLMFMLYLERNGCRKYRAAILIMVVVFACLSLSLKADVYDEPYIYDVIKLTEFSKCSEEAGYVYVYEDVYYDEFGFHEYGSEHKTKGNPVRIERIKEGGPYLVIYKSRPKYTWFTANVYQKPRYEYVFFVSE